MQRLNEGGLYFKVRGIILMKYQNFVIFSFQINGCGFDYVVVDSTMWLWVRIT